jgi:putative CocE/NonD family hydrolase
MGPLKNANDRYLKNTVPYWNEQLDHDTYDSYWQVRSLFPHLTDVHPAVLTVGGWFDAEDFYGTLQTYRTITAKSADTANFLVLGPWPHGGWAGGSGRKFGGLDFGAPTGAYYREKIEFPFFEYYLKGIGAPPDAGERARVFDTGTKQWLSFDSWPPHGASEQSLFLDDQHTLGLEKPKLDPIGGFDSYTSDPANPVPYSAHARTQSDRFTPYMAEDQSFVDSRPDVLTYRSAPLGADTAAAGPITADLYVSTTGTDTDFVVKVMDLYPAGGDAPADAPLAGKEILVRAEVMRGKFRDSYTNPSPFKPRAVTRVRFTLQDVCHTFKKGHRIAVQVQSSWFPLVDRNPQVFLHIPKAKDSDFHPADIRVYRSAEYPSRVVLTVR